MRLKRTRAPAGREEFQAVLEKIAHDFLKEAGASGLKVGQAAGIVGIQTRGVYLGRRIAEVLKRKHKFDCPVGSLDITLYRDDVGEIGKQPLVKETNIPFAIEGRFILLVDDVLYTGRTIRAALDALLELGRPKRIRLGVMVDRGGRELPIQADYCGPRVDAGAGEEVRVLVKEVDGEDGVRVVEKA